MAFLILFVGIAPRFIKSCNTVDCVASFIVHFLGSSAHSPNSKVSSYLLFYGPCSELILLFVVCHVLISAGDPSLTLTPQILADIYTNHIRYWDDPSNLICCQALVLIWVQSLHP